MGLRLQEVGSRSLVEADHRDPAAVTDTRTDFLRTVQGPHSPGVAAEEPHMGRGEVHHMEAAAGSCRHGADRSIPDSTY